MIVCFCAESNSSDLRGSVNGRKVELKAKITDLSVVCGAVHVGQLVIPSLSSLASRLRFASSVTCTAAAGG